MGSRPKASRQLLLMRSASCDAPVCEIPNQLRCAWDCFQRYILQRGKDLKRGKPSEEADEYRATIEWETANSDVLR